MPPQQPPAAGVEARISPPPRSLVVPLLWVMKTESARTLFVSPQCGQVVGSSASLMERSLSCFALHVRQ
jgi:hypothetical protein